ncbi:MAG TPA: hypothetical protein VGY56_09985 [Verrucomicrobiae bacterium]|nr:hypothetical protein [Verrucomicrobiae bacterium]
MTAVAHYIAGVLPWEAMAEIVDSLSATADGKPGDRVKTLRGSLHGKILRVLEDGRIVWPPNGMDSEYNRLARKSLRKSEARAAYT